MGLPDLPLPTPPADLPHQPSDDCASPPSQTLQSRGTKRTRDQSEPHGDLSTPAKRTVPTAILRAEHKNHLRQAVRESEKLACHDKYSPSLLFNTSSGAESVSVRDLIDFVVQESLKGSSSSYVSPFITDGPSRRVEAEVTLSNGNVKSKTVEWTIRPCVPEFVLGKCKTQMSGILADICGSR